MLGLLIGLAFVSAIVASSVAGQKGKSPGPYFLLGFLFPLIGILAAAATPADKLAKLETPGTEGWQPDPTGRFDQRYHDGKRWTKWVMRGDQRLEDLG